MCHLEQNNDWISFCSNQSWSASEKLTYIVNLIFLNFSLGQLSIKLMSINLLPYPIQNCSSFCWKFWLVWLSWLDRSSTVSWSLSSSEEEVSEQVLATGQSYYYCIKVLIIYLDKQKLKQNPENTTLLKVILNCTF